LDDDQDVGWVSVSSGTISPGLSWTKGRKTVAVIVDLGALTKAHAKEL